MRNASPFLHRDSRARAPGEIRRRTLPARVAVFFFSVLSFPACAGQEAEIAPGDDETPAVVITSAEDLRQELRNLSASTAAEESVRRQSHEAVARETLKLVNARETLESARKQMYPLVVAAANDLGIPESRKADSERYLLRMLDLMEQELSWDAMEPVMIRAYMNVFSETELRELNEFYASPLGQKYVTRTPRLNDEVARATGIMIRQFLPRLYDLQEELKSEIGTDELDADDQDAQRPDWAVGG